MTPSKTSSSSLIWSWGSATRYFPVVNIFDVIRFKLSWVSQIKPANLQTENWQTSKIWPAVVTWDSPHLPEITMTFYKSYWLDVVWSRQYVCYVQIFGTWRHRGSQTASNDSQWQSPAVALMMKSDPIKLSTENIWKKDKDLNQQPCRTYTFHPSRGTIRGWLSPRIQFNVTGLSFEFWLLHSH